MCLDGATASERDVQLLYGGCWRDFMLWGYQAYDMTDASWDPAGKLHACNIELPFAKVINSLFVICHGLANEVGGAWACSQWHSTEDYRSLVVAADNSYHSSFYVRFIDSDGGGHAAGTRTNPLGSDRTDLYCRCFDLHRAVGPGPRAAMMLHEALHLWLAKWGFDPSHSSCGGDDCDTYHVNHPWPWGELFLCDLHPATYRMMSPYQIQAEFLGDLHIFHRLEVPISTVLEARTIGNDILANRFRNPPAYRVGSPKPF